MSSKEPGPALEWPPMSSEQGSYESEPTRERINQTGGPVLLEFGASWCGHCQALHRPLAELLKAFPQVQHIKVEDAKGRPLGRSFHVKLWPNLVFLRDGQVIMQLARPRPEEVRAGLEAITKG